MKKQDTMIGVIKEDYQAFVRNNNKRKAQEVELKKYMALAVQY